MLRNLDGIRIKSQDILNLAAWQANAPREDEIPFVVSRILLQDFTGVPLLVDLAAMRSAVKRLGRDPKLIEPLVPVDLVIDHSIQVDYAKTPDALTLNMGMEFKRNLPRYQFLKWGQKTFKTFRIVPPGIGICHQVNLEYLAKLVWEKDGICYPDTLVGTDSHTTMIGGLGAVGWGVGGIEAEAGMLGQPIYFLTPDVVGVYLTGKLCEGVSATDLVLTVTQILRKAGVVGKFVEFHGEGAASLSIPDRATIANMAPEYGATIGIFPVDERTCEYLLATGRTSSEVELVRRYYQAQGLFGMPVKGQCHYSTLIEMNLADVTASVSGPARPQDRLDLSSLKNTFFDLLLKDVFQNGYGKSRHELDKNFIVKMGRPREASQMIAGGGEQSSQTIPEGVNDVSPKHTSAWTEREMIDNRPTPNFVEENAAKILDDTQIKLSHGSVVIAAITSCTNTSNPSVMLAAGLLAKKAFEKGLTVPSHIKTSFAPGSRVVSEYLKGAGLDRYLDALGFQIVGYGCTTCIGNSGPLDPDLETVIKQNDVIVASVLSGNRNFEARIHQNVKANFLMSPPLVVAFALAGTVLIDLTSEPLGRDRDGQDVYLKEIWPTSEELNAVMSFAMNAEYYRRLYGEAVVVPLWQDIVATASDDYDWDENATYIQEPPYFDKFGMDFTPPKDIKNARALAIFGDSVTTDHISPAGAIEVNSPAGLYLRQKNIATVDFNSYGARRGNDRVMTRGTFANVRIRNLIVPGLEGGITRLQPTGEIMSIYDAAMLYQTAGTPLVIFAGKEYGMGSSRDWAAKGTKLLGVKAVIAESFERIHRSNLIGMGILPCQFLNGLSVASLKLDGSETFAIDGLSNIIPRKNLNLIITRTSGVTERLPILMRLDTPIEVDYYKNGGILQYVLRQILRAPKLDL
jgi:aconitate hydratase